MIAIGIGLAWKTNKLRLVSNLINSFKARVAADSGLFEAESCLNATLTNLNNI